MPFVLDASVAASWILRDESDALATEALLRRQRDEALMPRLWWFEIRNVLFMSERLGRITEAESAAFLSDLTDLPLVPDRSPDESDTRALARLYRLTFYDATCLELAAS